MFSHWVGNYSVIPFSRARRAAQDITVALRKHLIHGLVEADVTYARSLIHTYRLATGEQLSFTAFVIGCVAHAVHEDKALQAYRWGHKRLVVFDDVDVTTMIERECAGEGTLIFHVVRAANTRSVTAIHQEIRVAQRASTKQSVELMGAAIFGRLPGIVRRALVRLATRIPYLWKSIAGTVMVTALGMVGEGGGWGIPIICNTLAVTIGGLHESASDKTSEPRQLLDITISGDHDIVDGAPLARFASHLRQLLEQGYGLDAIARAVTSRSEPRAPAHRGLNRAPAHERLPAHLT